jgi:hypothetical protein
LQHDDLVRWRQHFEQRELHVRAHEACVALRQQQRPGKAGRLCCKRARVHNARTCHRVDAEAVPGNVGKGQTGYDRDVDTRRAQQQDRALGD